MECPKCSAPYGASDLECARCGLVLTIGLASHRVGLAMMAGALFWACLSLRSTAPRDV